MTDQQIQLIYGTIKKDIRESWHLFKLSDYAEREHYGKVLALRKIEKMFNDFQMKPKSLTDIAKQL